MSKQMVTKVLFCIVILNFVTVLSLHGPETIEPSLLYIVIGIKIGHKTVPNHSSVIVVLGLWVQNRMNMDTHECGTERMSVIPDKYAFECI